MLRDAELLSLRSHELDSGSLYADIAEWRSVINPLRLAMVWQREAGRALGGSRRCRSTTSALRARGRGRSVARCPGPTAVTTGDAESAGRVGFLKWRRRSSDGTTPVPGAIVFARTLTRRLKRYSGARPSSAPPAPHPSTSGTPSWRSSAASTAPGSRSSDSPVLIAAVHSEDRDGDAWDPPSVAPDADRRKRQGSQPAVGPVAKGLRLLSCSLEQPRRTGSLYRLTP